MGALILIPLTTLEFTDYFRISFLILLALLSLSIGMLRRKIEFGKTDLAWLLIIIATAASGINAINPTYVWHGCMTTVLLYAAFKSFQTMTWTKAIEEIYLHIFTVLWIIGLATQVYILWDGLYDNNHRVISGDLKTILITGVNLNYINTYLVALTPFVFIKNDGLVFYLKIPLLILLLLLIYGSGSMWAFLLLILVMIGLAGFHLKIRKKVILGASVILILVGTVALLLINHNRGNLRGINPLVSEFSTQNDRFWMWKTSFDMWKEHPVLGHGKNNWTLAHPRKGYIGCNFCTGPRSVRFEHAHNAAMQILSELGILGAAGYGLLGLLVIGVLLRKSEGDSPFLIAAMASLVCFILATMLYGVVYNYKNNFSGLTFLSVFILALIAKKPQASSGQSSKIDFVFALSLLLGLVGAGYANHRFEKSVQQFRDGVTKIRAGDLDEARTILQKATLFGNRPNIYRSIGDSYLLEKNFKEAYNNHDTAISYDPYNRKLILNLGHKYFNSKKFKRALSMANKNLALHSSHEPSLILKARALAGLGRKRAALKIARDLRKKYERRRRQEDKVTKMQKLIDEITGK